MCANDQLVDLEVVRAADDGTVGVFFALEIAWIEVSTGMNQEDRRQTYFVRPALRASIGVAMFEG